ncbi:aryl-alcohol dehydrogenase-like predicted oxidoreductase [Litoreibacter halocynthiae]|uniref:Aryl-alcohol dehydrogenase-like predicted oxidoreductase n=1 Tax=Litoreibacter halocynthiae TaxID=1242689 RepID=A0A4R7LIP9_9RHOB|nr:aldo/keto reductase [Litoreibacter halocynthiae]TDT75159.1 aryl-alcohol dehydrogenase-like predicted oxidoreductase [Litoreibacter halocynthiae]
MKKTRLGRTDLMVSQFCLGSMTWGTQTSEAEGHQQIDASLDAGINFIDTAEAYPVNPMNKENAGRTEEIIGNWFAKSGRRNDVVLATKVAGAGNYIRDGEEISSKTIREAVEGSLRRLQTDVIDLYQLHWPNRGSYMFRQNWSYDPSGQDRAVTVAHMEDVLGALQGLVAEGKIRHFGLSNESAWGTMMWLQIAERMGAPRVQSIQNEYSLLCRLYDTDLAELGHNEDVSLLAFSPLAVGFLTGKYQGGKIPEGSRMSINEKMGGRASDRVLDVAQVYLDIAAKHGLDPVHMSLAWCCQRPFPVIPIFGATTMDQLNHIIAGKGLVLGQDVLDDITAAHKANPMPY